MSRAEWPVARIKNFVSKISPEDETTELMVLLRITRSVIFFSKKISPPHCKIVSRIDVIMWGNLLVPMWGCASYKIFSSAPN